MCHDPWSKVAILGMVTPPLIGILISWVYTPYYWVDDHSLLYGNNGSLDPIAHITLKQIQDDLGLGIILPPFRIPDPGCVCEPGGF